MSTKLSLAVSPARQELIRICEGIERGNGNFHRCAYCPSTNTTLLSVDVREKYGTIGAVIQCNDCGKMDRPAMGIEAFKLLIMYA